MLLGQRSVKSRFVILLLGQANRDGDAFLVLGHGHVVKVVKEFWRVLAVGRVAWVLGRGQESFIALRFGLGFVFHDPTFGRWPDWGPNKDWLHSLVLAWHLW